VPPMRELNPEIHPDLETIVRRALAKDRDQRYATAPDLHDDLQSVVYAHGCRANASALRSYLRDHLPAAAPPPDELPPSAPSRPPEVAPPKPTYRPPSRSEMVPPAPSVRPPAPPVHVPPASLAELPQEPSFLLDPI